MVLAALTGLGLAGPAAAQDWSFQSDTASGWTSAVTCVPGSTGHTSAICLSVGCDAGLGPHAVMSVTEGQVPEQFEAALIIDGDVAGVFDFRRDESGITFAAPLDEQDALLDGLRLGSQAEIRIETGGKPIEHALSLRGSQAAIDRMLAACPSPGAERVQIGGGVEQGGAGRTSDDPAGEAIAENAAYCAGGATTVEPGFLRQADVNGDGVNDVILSYLGLTCDGSRAFCGTGGCTEEVWLGSATGPYTLLLSDLIVSIEVTAPGQIRVVKDGGDCGLSGAESCTYDYRVDGLTLRPLE
jgi:hypothetical protein